MRSGSASKLGLLIAAVALIWLAGAGTQSLALDRGTFSLELLVDGVPLTEYELRDRTYVEALEDHEYAIRLANRTGRRVAVALSVDGLNTIDAKSSSARKGSKWILGPWETITLRGWQTGSDTARRFFFTTEEKSYGAWLGKTRNLGLITAAVFRERLPEPVPIQRYELGDEEAYPSRTSGASAPEGAGRRQDAAADSGKPETESRSKADFDSPKKRSRRVKETQPEPSKEMAATGIGRKYGHRVHRVRFEADPAPPTLLELRYEYRDALIRLGALPAQRPYWEDPLERREGARGFEEFDFAPDPYR